MSKVRAIYFYLLLAILLVMAVTTGDLFVAGRRLASIVCFAATFALGSAIIGLKSQFDFSPSPSAVRLPSSVLRNAAILSTISVAGGVFVLLMGLQNGGVDLVVGLIGGIAFFLLALLMAAAVYFGRRLPTQRTNGGDNRLPE